MSLEKAKCFNCGSIITVDSSREFSYCEYCGNKYAVKEAINNYTKDVSDGDIITNGGGSSEFIRLLEKYEFYSKAELYRSKEANDIRDKLEKEYPEKKETNEILFLYWADNCIKEMGYSVVAGFGGENYYNIIKKVFGETSSEVEEKYAEVIEKKLMVIDYINGFTGPKAGLLRAMILESEYGCYSYDVYDNKDYYKMQKMFYNSRINFCDAEHPEDSFLVRLRKNYIDKDEGYVIDRDNPNEVSIFFSLIYYAYLSEIKKDIDGFANRIVRDYNLAVQRSREHLRDNLIKGLERKECFVCGKKLVKKGSFFNNWEECQNPKCCMCRPGPIGQVLTEIMDENLFEVVD